MRDEHFIVHMKALIRNQLSVSLRLDYRDGPSRFQVVAIGLGYRSEKLYGAFVNVVKMFEEYADKEAIEYIPAQSIRELTISDSTANYPMHWIRTVQNSLSQSHTLETEFPNMFKKPKIEKPVPTNISNMRDGKLYSRSGKRILKPPI